MVTVTISGAGAGKNGTYFLGGGIETMEIYTVPNSWALSAWKEQIPANIGWATADASLQTPGHPVFLEYDRNNQLVPGQCVQVINSPNSYLRMNVSLNTTGGTNLTPGQSAYFTTSSNVGDIVFTSSPCSSGPSSMMLFGRDISSGRSSKMPWVMLFSIIVLLILIVVLSKTQQ